MRQRVDASKSRSVDALAVGELSTQTGYETIRRAREQKSKVESKVESKAESKVESKAGPKNRKDGSDLDDFLTKSIAPARSIF